MNSLREFGYKEADMTHFKSSVFQELFLFQELCISRALCGALNEKMDTSRGEGVQGRV